MNILPWLNLWLLILSRLFIAFCVFAVIAHSANFFLLQLLEFIRPLLILDPLFFRQCLQAFAFLAYHYCLTRLIRRLHPLLLLFPYPLSGLYLGVWRGLAFGELDGLLGVLAGLELVEGETGWLYGGGRGGHVAAGGGFGRHLFPHCSSGLYLGVWRGLAFGELFVGVETGWLYGGGRGHAAGGGFGRRLHPLLCPCRSSSDQGISCGLASGELDGLLGLELVGGETRRLYGGGHVAAGGGEGDGNGRGWMIGDGAAAWSGTGGGGCGNGCLCGSRGGDLGLCHGMLLLLCSC